MKKISLQLMTMSVLALSANAQLQMSSQASYLTGHGKNDNHTTLLGVTLAGSYTITDNMAVGSVIHKYKPKKSSYKVGNFSYTATDDVTNVSATYDLLLGAKGGVFQPYIGIDMGISTSNHNIEYLNEKDKLVKKYIRQRYTMMSPKAGVNMPISGSFGMYSQIQYNYSPGNGGPVTINVTGTKTVTTITTEPISKYYNIDTGIYMLIGNKKKIM